MQNKEQLHASPHRSTSICFSYESSAPSDDDFTHTVPTVGDRNRLSHMMTLGNTSHGGSVIFGLIGDSEQQDLMTCCD